MSRKLTRFSSQGRLRALAVALALTVACQPATQAVPSQSVPPVVANKSLKIIGTEPQRPWDPTAATTRSGWQIIEFLADPLLDRGPKFELTPWLAEKWDAQEGGKVWVFTLRKGALFSDGTPITASDVVFSFQTYAKADLWKSKMTTFDAIVAVDPQTVRMTLKQATPNFFDLPLTTGQYLILSKASVEKAGTTELDKQSATSGPYVVKEYVPKGHVTLTRNPNYWKLAEGFPKFSEIRYDFVEDPAVQAAAIAGGTADFLIDAVSPTSVKQLKSNANVTTYLATAPNYIGIGFRSDIPPVNDKRVRQAVGYLQDTAEMLDVCYAGSGSPLYGGFEYTWQTFYRDDPGTQPWKIQKADRLQTATRLLDQAGWMAGSDGLRSSRGVQGVPDGTPFRITVHYRPAGFAGYVCHVQLFQQWLKQVGIQVDLKGEDNASYYADVDKGKFEFWHCGCLGFLDQATTFRSTFHSAGDQQSRYAQFKKPGPLDAAIEAAEAEANPQRKSDLYNEIHKTIADNQWVWMTNSLDVTLASSAKLKGYFARTDRANRALITADLN